VIEVPNLSKQKIHPPKILSPKNPSRRHIRPPFQPQSKFTVAVERIN